MRTTARLALAASATFAFASLGAVVPAQAATQHCPEGEHVELSGDDATIDTDLAEGSIVCIKVGTVAVTDVVVGEGGSISNTTVFNKNGKLQGISYYVVTDECNPSLEDCDGEEEPSGNS